MSNFKKIHLHGTRVKQKGKKGHRKRKYLGGMGGKKHGTSGTGTNHRNAIERTRETNREEEHYQAIRKKRKGYMCDNVINLFRTICK